MAVHPLRPATRRRLGRPLPHQQADRPRAHPTPKKLSTTDTKRWSYPVLDPVSQAYPEVQGRSPTCYSPVRHSSTPKGLSVRLACVKHAASVRPEPGSNSPQKIVRHQSPKEPDTQQKNYQTNQPPQSTRKNQGLAKTNIGTLLSSHTSQPTPTRTNHPSEMQARRSLPPTTTGSKPLHLKIISPSPPVNLSAISRRLELSYTPQQHNTNPQHKPTKPTHNHNNKSRRRHTPTTAHGDPALRPGR